MEWLIQTPMPRPWLVWTRLPTNAFPGWLPAGSGLQTVKSGSATRKEDVPYQFGFGEFTAKDVLHAMERQQWPDSQSGSATYFKDVTVEAIDDHTVKFVLPFVGVDMVARVSRGWGGGELLMYSAPTSLIRKVLRESTLGPPGPAPTSTVAGRSVRASGLKKHPSLTGGVKIRTSMR